MTFLSVTLAHVMHTFACACQIIAFSSVTAYIHTNYLRDVTQNYLPRSKALGNYSETLLSRKCLTCNLVYCKKWVLLLIKPQITGTTYTLKIWYVYVTRENELSFTVMYYNYVNTASDDGIDTGITM